MSYVLSSDVTNPQAVITIEGKITKGGVIIDRIETGEDGISRLLSESGQQLEQYPGIHASFSWVTGVGAYGRCMIEGPLVAFKTRPEDPAYVYTLVQLP